ncbi:alpha/beta fold hydrolase [Streptomyces brasiliensis]|uniref:Alpha/beta hydrolase n=1 Tax=Streptomyces brasiliensis TaxID=1954 RepID=A0A917P0U4_9ACTN|nr:alpha/beta hydrolase [Streptomyces brasiliensis]GGJ49406.1 alpha/beta hydrolase [Streptomyces brasiliensis]
MTQIKNVVLVHGEFEDGSAWHRVYELLTSDGYRVTVVQHPALSLAGDVLATLRVLRAQDGPCVLVGHSYGGVVITEAGTDDNVAALVYVAALAPDSGESVHDLAPGAHPLPVPRDDFMRMDRALFHESFAADLPPAEARFMADSQVPWRVDALDGRVSRPAWRTKPSWYLVATDDRVIPPSMQRAMARRAGSTVLEIAASHSVHMSQPRATADLIRQAAMRAKESPERD